MWRKSLKSSAIYSTKSKIENLKMTVSLKSINSLLKIEKFEVKTITHHPDKLNDESDFSSKNDGDSVETIGIKWQQKIFSRYEIEFYKDLQNCSTDIQKEYHKRIMENSLVENLENWHRKIFTYTEDDDFNPTDNLNEFQKTTNKNDKNKTNMNSSHPHSKSKIMYIYADLNPDTLLFMIRWLETEQLLIVYPDFNEFDKNPYFIEIDSDYRHLYSYAVQNTSATTSIPTEQNIFLIEQHQSNNTTSSDIIPSTLQKNLSSLYDMPPKKFIRISFLFEIQEAKNFEYDSLHVRYRIKLPSDISGIKIENGQLTGSTHSSRYSYSHSDDENNIIVAVMGHRNKIWNFGFIFQLNLLMPEQELHNKKESYLRTFFEIISIDDWERERIEGYGYLLVLIKPGMEKYKLNCFRPDYGFWDRVGRFFIGGRKLFDDEKFNKTDSSDGFLNRFQTKCISTGYLKLKIQCIWQTNPELVDFYNDSKEGLKKKSSGMTLNDIMEAYQKARKRLEATTLESNNNSEC